MAVLGNGIFIIFIYTEINNAFAFVFMEAVYLSPSLFHHLI